MSNEHQKADQIAYRFYTKLTLVVNDARATAEPRPNTKVDKWFNLETPDSDLFKDHLRVYRTISSAQTIPRFELQVLLSIPGMNNNQVLVHLAPDGTRTRIDPTPKHILLESWVLNFTPRPHQSSDDDHTDVAPSTCYKHGIPLFRSIYTLLRILPAWKSHKRLRRRLQGINRSGNFIIQLRVAPAERSADILDLDTPPAPNAEPLSNDTHVFPPIRHPMGSLALHVRHLSAPNFQLDELESLLSSRFLSLDEATDFTPTLTKNQQRDSLLGTGSPGSLPIRIPLPRSPPDYAAAAIADRFILPAAHSRTASLPGSARLIAPSISRHSSSGGPGSTSGTSVTSSARQDTSSAWWSKDEGRSATGVASRLRKESLKGADLPSAPGPLPIRRPNLNVVHPFKSATLSSGSPSFPSPPPSLRNPSPLSSTHSRAAQTSAARVPPSPVGVGAGVGSRPSPPPFAPSSLGDRRSLASAEGDDQSPRPLGRKRYSSSFGHRYAVAGAGSEGSAGSGERKDPERPGSASFLSTNTDDDDISAFVQDIDARKPLRGRAPSRDRDRAGTASPRISASGLAEENEDGAGRVEREAEARSDPSGQEGAGDAGAGAGVAGDAGAGEGGGGHERGAEPMLTSEEEVDARLRQLNAAFAASLAGLGDGTRRRRAAGARPANAGASDGAGDGAGLGGAGAGAGPRPSAGGGSGAGATASSGRPSLSRHVSGARSEGGGGAGSEEVVGRLSLDGDSRRR